MTVKPIPETSPRVIPMLVCRNPEAEIEFCERVLQAEVGVRRPGPDGKTIHAALELGEARIIIQAEFPHAFVNLGWPHRDHFIWPHFV